MKRPLRLTALVLTACCAFASVRHANTTDS